MIHDYSEDHSLEKATAMTFSGDHPCEMCLCIAAAKSAESAKQEDQKAPLPSEDRQSFRAEFQQLSKSEIPNVKQWRKSRTSPRAGQSLLTSSRVEESIPTPPPRHLSA